ncbi:DMT family transporter [Geofilum sp. OHC36d9]|uniref:DMT family transporter n=1 Tax=Geofilum sp. OHC36d9 TaxID=3458413 RepID=UPI004033764F
MIYNKIKGHLAMTVANISWGLMAPLSKSVMLFGTVSYLSLVAYRLAGAAIAFWVASLFIKKEKVQPRDFLFIFAASLFAIIFNQGVFIMGVSYTSPINASIITTLLPIMAMAISAVYLKEPITIKKLTGVVIGGAGATIIILSSYGTSAAGGTKNNLFGIALCFMAQFSYAIYFVIFKKFVEKYSPITLMKWMFLFAVLCYAPFSLHEVWTVDYAAISLTTYRDIAFIVFGSTFLSYLMIPIGQKNLRPTVATMYNNVQPIVASIAAAAMGLDTFGPIKASAIGLVILGVYIVNKSKSREQLIETADFKQ